MVFDWIPIFSGHLPQSSCINLAGQTAEEAAQPMQVSDAPVWHSRHFAQTLRDMGADQQMLSNYTTPLDESYEARIVLVTILKLFRK